MNSLNNVPPPRIGDIHNEYNSVFLGKMKSGQSVSTQLGTIKQFVKLVEEYVEKNELSLGDIKLVSDLLTKVRTVELREIKDSMNVYQKLMYKMNNLGVGTLGKRLDKALKNIGEKPTRDEKMRKVTQEKNIPLDRQDRTGQLKTEAKKFAQNARKLKDQEAAKREKPINKETETMTHTANNFARNTHLLANNRPHA